VITIKRFKVAAFVFFAVTVFIVNWQPVHAAYFDCIGSTMEAIYYGSEVQCDQGWKDNYCVAGCAYCFKTTCDAVTSCDPGEQITAHCTNTPIIEG
jgi:hypothetical protein